MSIFKRDVLTHSFPAYDIFSRDVDSRHGGYNLVAGEKLALMRNSHGEEYADTYVIGSVVSYALENGECPIKATQQAQEHNHKLHYIFSLGASISSGKSAKQKLILVNVGDVVKFEGHLFTIENAPNDNLCLEPCGEYN